MVPPPPSAYGRMAGMYVLGIQYNSNCCGYGVDPDDGLEEL